VLTRDSNRLERFTPIWRTTSTSSLERTGSKEPFGQEPDIFSDQTWRILQRTHSRYVRCYGKTRCFWSNVTRPHL